MSISFWQSPAPAVRKLFKMAVGCFSFFLLLSSCAERAQQKTDRPNFLVIFTDDQTYRAIGYNNKLVKTPNLDALAGQGIIFDKAFTASPICVASRASILTGLYPQKNGTVALNTHSFIQREVKERQYKTLAHFLADAGYATYFSGKSHLGDPRDYGFLFGEESTDFTDTPSFRKVADFIKEPGFGEKPYLIWLAAKQPHLPLKPQQQWIDLYEGVDFPLAPNFRESPLRESFFNQGLPGENLYLNSDYTDNYKNLSAGPPRSPETIKEFVKAYYATISHLDAQVGALIRQLRLTGKLENTIVIFLSDNGYFLGNHGLGNKITMHEESVRVPFFIYGDRLKNKGTRFEQVVSSLDVLPTVLDLAGIPLPDYLHGKSLKNVLLSDDSSQIHDYVVSECTGVGGQLGQGHRMVRNRNWKYILSDTNQEALYNLEEDPYELNNLIGVKEYGSLIARLKKDLADWKSLAGDKKEYH
ncbi:MAG: sulfatase-like hydrolase/transferase [Chitinophagaceae bacterium]|nr:sulfatase-like hydrolase/transferase [Chitinophagaceae bacterium]